MDLSLQSLSSLAAFIFLASLKTTLLVVLVLVIRRVADRHLSASTRYLLWFTVVISLVSPVGFDTTLPASLLTEAGHETSAARTGELPTAISVSSRTPSSFALPADSLRPETSTLADTPASSWLLLLPYVWLAGVLAVLGVIVASGRRFAQLVRRASPAPDEVQDFLQDCMRQTSCAASVTVLYSADIQVPMIAGVFKPVLLLPEGMEQQLTRAQLRHVFIHELMHLQRGDIVSNWIVALAQALHWFNPAIWFAFFCMRQDRELACDAATLRHLEPADRVAYGHTLLQLNDTLPQKPLPVVALGMLDASSHLQRRIRMLVRSARYRKLHALVTALLLLPLAAIAFSQPASRSAVDVAVDVPATAISQPQIPTAGAVPTDAGFAPTEAAPVQTATPASVEPVAPVAVPAATVPVAVDVPASPPRSPPTALLAQLDSVALDAPSDVDALAPEADTRTLIAAVSAAQPVATRVEPYADLALIEQLAAEISAVQAEKIRFIEKWNDIGATCEARKEGPLGNFSASCQRIRTVLRRGDILRFGFECHALNSLQADLFDEYRAIAAQQSGLAGVEAAIRANEQDLAAFCSKDTYSEQYPAFAAIFADAESLKYYPPRADRRPLMARNGERFGPPGYGTDLTYPNGPSWTSGAPDPLQYPVAYPGAMPASSPQGGTQVTVP